MKKYETLDGTPIELDHEGWLDSGGTVISPTALAHLAELGIIRKRSYSVTDFKRTFSREDRGYWSHTETTRLIQRIIDKGLVDQLLDND